MPRFFALSPKDVDRVHDELKELFRKKGHGCLQDLEADIGVRRDYFSYNRRRSVLDLGALLSALKWLEVEPADFFSAVFGGRETPAWKGPDPMAATGPPVPAVARSSPEVSGDELHRLERWIERLDGMRYTDTEAALVELRSRVDEIPNELAASYLSAVGSCLRMIGNLAEAQETLELARAWAGDDHAAAGDALQRLAYVVTDHGRYNQALDVLDRAAMHYLKLGKSDLLGRIFVDRAPRLMRLERLDEAADALATARRLIPASDPRGTFAIEQYSVELARRLGNVEGCREAAEALIRLAPAPHFEAMAWATLAGVLCDVERFEEGAACYRKQLTIEGTQPIDGLLATLHLIQALGRAGRSDEALGSAKTIVAYMGVLRGNALAEAAVVEIYRSACSNRIKLSVVEALRTEVLSLTESHGKRGDTLGDRIRRCRRLRGCSRAQAARESGVPEESLRKIESGAIPGTRYAGRLARWLRSSRPELTLAEPAASRV